MEIVDHNGTPLSERNFSGIIMQHINCGYFHVEIIVSNSSEDLNIFTKEVSHCFEIYFEVMCHVNGMN